ACRCPAIVCLSLSHCSPLHVDARHHASLPRRAARPAPRAWTQPPPASHLACPCTPCYSAGAAAEPSRMEKTMQVRPFRAQASPAMLDDLRERLARARWPDEVEGAQWDYGANLAYVRGLSAYWQGQFDWRAQEGRINGFANFRADVDGFGIHFVHERGRG